MKRVRINAGFIGLVFKNGDFKRVIEAGVHWVTFSEQVKVYSMTQPFEPDVDLNLLLIDEELRQKVDLIEVGDEEIVLCFENGNFKTVLVPGRYAFWKGLVKREYVKSDLSKVEIEKGVKRSLLSKPILLPYIRVFVVEPNEKGTLFIDGKFSVVLQEGVYYFWKNSTPVQVLKADMRTQEMELNGQEMLTRDKAALRINFTAQYKVVDVEKALVENKDFGKQLYTLIQLALRGSISAMSLDELLLSKDELSSLILELIRDRSQNLGIKISDCGIKDIILPGEIKDIMNQVLVAEKKAQANLVSRREETASTRSMLNTAKLMEENPMLLKLKEMEYTEKIAERIKSISLSAGNHVADQLREIFTG